MAVFTVRSLKDVPAHMQEQATRLYWSAFSAKLGRLLGPDARALRLLGQVVQPDHALVALDAQGQLIGVAGFRSRRGGFLMLGRADLCRVYGRFGGRLRFGLVSWLTAEVDNIRFPIDGLVTLPQWRSQGVGTALIAALEQVARDAGYDRMRLDVDDANPRAKALYLRLGFTPLSQDRRWLLAPVFGMKSATAMEKRL